MADSAEAFARAVTQLLESTGLRDRLGKYARSFVIDHFNWVKNLDNFEHLLMKEPADCDLAVNNRLDTGRLI
jgi:glycosyltransferase involved in cell wall biosynthesis